MKPGFENLTGNPLSNALHSLKVSVVGLGKSGTSACKLLLKLGCTVYASDQKDCSLPNELRFNKNFKVDFGFHSREIINSQLIIVSPGIPWNLDLLEECRKNGKPVWGELELGYRLTPHKKIAAITGTNGKTTTTALLGEMVRKSGQKTLVAGNIGTPLSDFACLKDPYDTIVLEVSSYQLEGISKFSVQTSAILNLTNDHLQRHKTMDLYAKAKARIFLNQTKTNDCILNADDEWCKKISESAPSRARWFSLSQIQSDGVYWDRQQNKIKAKFNPNQKIITFNPSPHLIGEHNIANSCAAIACALSLDIPFESIQEGLDSFPGVEHRLERVKIWNGITFINDSKGTNVDSTLKALLSIHQPLWVILGGQDKGGSYQPLRSLIEKKNLASAQTRIKGIFLIGEAADKIQHELNGCSPLYFSRTLEQAVRDSSIKATDGDVVLLSPACASFDQFKNFEERGALFKKLVHEIKISS